jgi:pimeloyl-ACP methyl ester carboxylesterase
MAEHSAEHRAEHGVECGRADVGRGIELAYECFGDPSGQPLLMVMGLAAQMLLWPDAMCEQLADRGFRVVRYDNRDVGLSTRLDQHAPPSLPTLLATVARPQRVSAAYTLRDMADDAAGLLDHLGWSSAHVVGASMGGMIAQTLAIHHPERVRSLTSIMSTTGSRRVGLPAPRALKALLTRPEPTAEAYAEHLVGFLKLTGSPAYPHDPDDVRALARACFARGMAGAGAARHLHAVLASGSRTHGLRSVKVPTLVMHGCDDPLVSVSGGVATAEAVPGAELRLFPGMGHDLPKPLWGEMIDRIAGVALR